MIWYFVLLLVVCRIVAATWANVLQKKSASDLSQSRLTALVWLVAIWSWMTLFLAPWWIVSFAEIFCNHPSIAIRFWSWMLLACSMEVPGNYLLLRSLQRTDLSIFGPLNSYKPIFGMLLAWILLAELPSVLGLIGMLIVMFGSYLLADPIASKHDRNSDAQPEFWHSGIRDRLAGVALTAAGAVALKISMLTTDPWTSLAVWSVAGWVIAVVATVLARAFGLLFRWNNANRSQPAIALYRLVTNRQTVAIALAMLVMQGCTIWILKQMPVGYALALFQLGSLLSVYAGHRWFGEPQLWKRFGAATIMVLGAALIVISR